MTPRLTFRCHCLPAGLAAALFTVPAFASTPNFNFDRSPETIATQCNETLTTGNQKLDEISDVEAGATFQNVIVPFDAMMVDVVDEFFINYLMTNVHPDATIREAATACFQQLFAFYNQLSLNRPFFERVSAIDTEGLSEEDRYMVEYWLDQFRASGVDQDEETRKKVFELQQEITAIGREFDQAIQEDVRRMEVRADRLSGLPEDYLENHPANENGRVTISTSYADVSPVLNYAEDDELRREVLLMFGNRGYPQNEATLRRLLEKRHELATLLDHDNFAELAMLGTMMGDPERAETFLSTLSEAVEQPVAREKAQLLDRLQEIDPQAEAVQPWQSSFLSELLRKEDYALDAKEVRTYFNYDKVKGGILELTSDLFDIEIEQWDTKTWHEDVEAYTVQDNGQVIGRFFLDMHPRDGKFTHAAQFGVQFGVQGRQEPVATLVTNFPDGAMEHGQVETFLHEFGHLLHFIFAGQSEFGFRRFMIEADFGEAPSQMLEEWVWDYDTLKKFASNDDGEVIPQDLVVKMNDARYFGQGIATATQLSYALLSLGLYDRDPATIDIDAFARENAEEHAPFGYMDGTHQFASFGHLNGYSSNYYTYQWSNAIAEDLLSRFREEGLRNTETAAEYREKVLAASGTKSANDLVTDFLGRPFTIDAYVRLLSSGGGL